MNEVALPQTPRLAHNLLQRSKVMNQLNSVSNFRLFVNNGPSVNQHQSIYSTLEPNTLIRSLDLMSFCYLPKLNEAICQIRDLATGEIRQALASKLLPISYGKDAYLLEFMPAVECSDDV